MRGCAHGPPAHRTIDVKNREDLAQATKRSSAMARSFDVFISYRRAGGDVIAQLLKEKLHRRGLRVFLDVSDLTNGQFEQALLRQIATAPKL